jgi:hypothetical protein
MDTAVSPFPDDVEALKALLAATLRRADQAEAQLANAQAQASATEAMIAHLKLQIAKLRREQYGASAERSRRLLDQMELQLEDLEGDASEDDLAAEVAVIKTSVPAFERKKPSRKPFPEHLPRERVVIPAPCSCPACGGNRLSKLGEDVTETLEVIPRAWKVIQTVREKFSCRDCETITAAGAIPRRAAWLGRSQLSGDAAVREIRPAPAPQPAGRALCPRRCAACHLDAGRSGRRGSLCPDAALSADRGPCPGCAAAPWRRHHRAGHGQGQDRYGALVDLCPR